MHRREWPDFGSLRSLRLQVEEANYLRLPVDCHTSLDRKEFLFLESQKRTHC
jgi:hypothetical protein